MVVDGFCVSLIFPHASPGPPSSEHLCWWRSTRRPLPSGIYLCIPLFVMTKLWWKLSSAALWALLWSSAQVCLLPFPALQLLHGPPQLAAFPLCPRLVRPCRTCLWVRFDVLDRQVLLSTKNHEEQGDQVRAYFHLKLRSLSGVSLALRCPRYIFLFNVLRYVSAYQAIV